MARKVKRKRTAQKRKTTRRVRQKKISKNSSYLAIIVVLIVFVFVFYYFSLSKGPQQQPYQQPSGTTPTTSGQGAAASVGGFCKKDSECYVAYCKGQTKDCINTTQMATYGNDNCRSQSDFVLENKQDYSVCGCVQYACTMK